MISIIVPTLNSGDFLKPCLQSITSQKTQIPFEIILSDCGSTDSTLEIAKSFPCRVLHSKIKTAASARNLGLKEAKYSYIALIDSDVLIPGNWLDSLYQTLSTGPYQIVQSEVIPSGQKYIDSLRRKISLLGTNNTFNHINNSQLPKVTINTAACMIKNTQNVELQFDSSFKKVEDADFMTNLFFSGFNIKAIKGIPAQVYSNRGLFKLLLRNIELGFYSAKFDQKWLMKRAEEKDLKHSFKADDFISSLLLFSMRKLQRLGHVKFQKQNQETAIKAAPKIKKNNIKFIFNYRGKTFLCSPFARAISSYEGVKLVNLQSGLFLKLNSNGDEKASAISFDLSDGEFRKLKEIGLII